MPRRPQQNHATYQWKSADTKPIPYDLVLVAFENGTLQPMWWTGKKWDGFRDLPNSTVLEWRKMAPPH